MKSKVTIIAGHPDVAPERFSNALVEAYRKGAESAGKECRVIALGNIAFDPILHRGYSVIQELEPDLKKAQEDILWADHLVFCYPTWWGAMPVLLKGFIEGIFVPGYAFKYHKDSLWWDKLLKGRSTRIITTMDAPVWYYRFVYHSPGDHLLTNAILNFCGVHLVKTTLFSPVKSSNEKQRAAWLDKVRLLGESD